MQHLPHRVSGDVLQLFLVDDPVLVHEAVFLQPPVIKGDDSLPHQGSVFLGVGEDVLHGFSLIRRQVLVGREERGCLFWMIAGDLAIVRVQLILFSPECFSLILNMK